MKAPPRLRQKAASPARLLQANRSLFFRCQISVCRHFELQGNAHQLGYIADADVLHDGGAIVFDSPRTDA